MKRLFGTDGIRGIVGEGLTAELAFSVGRATGQVLCLGRTARPHALIGTDTRASGGMLSAALAAGLTAAGVDVTLLGVLPTPGVASLVLSRRADAGVVVSASHNSYEYNGIKIFGADGYKLPDALEEEIEALVGTPMATDALPITGIGQLYHDADPTGEYVDALCRSVDVDLSGLSVAIDCACGAACRTAEPLFSRLGVKASWLSATPDGKNINAGCGSTCLEPLSHYVREHGCDLGIAFDGDADRCLLVDAEGRTVDGDEILAMCALDRHRRGVAGSEAIVGTVMSNLGLSRFCREHGLGLSASAVGDRYVLERMRAEEISLGGEQSGHIIFAEHATTGDGQLTACQVLSLMARTHRSLRSLASSMTRYPQSTVSLPLNEQGRLAFYTDGAVGELLRSAEESLGAEGRLLVRPSGTEPRLRITVSAGDEETVNRIIGELSEDLMHMLQK